MDKDLISVVDYFRPPEKYFWRWAEGGHVIEWSNGDTICYRDELMAILKQLSQEGFPGLGSILLIISACRERYIPIEKEGGSSSVLRLMNYYGKNSSILQGMKDRLLEATRFLHQVSALPQEFRSGENRVWLIYIIFKHLDEKISEKYATRYIDSFNSGRLDHFIFKEGLPAHKADVFRDDLYWLRQASEVFPTARELEMAVRTGLKELPNAAEVEVLEQETGDLLQQLQEDPSTAGLAQLTHRLIAALNIPMHSHGSSDQLFGGVSDITNRGNLDRLLLSELAHDDLSLMARLANNEALYLRREELPSNPEKQRILLVDTTLKMWGLPRVFAISAALACAFNNKTKARISAYALLGNSFNEIDLTIKSGVVNALEQLDAALHCGPALTEFMGEPTLREEDEVFLITAEEALHNLRFQSTLQALKKPVNFLVTVNRAGQLQFYEYIKGRRKLLNEARFDLQELLFPAEKKRKTTINLKPTGAVPAFMHQTPCPLYFPASKIKFNADCFFEFKRGHVIVVTIDQRVLYWNSKTQGAREIIEMLEPGRYCFGSNGESIIYILVYSGSTKYTRLYEVNLELNYAEITKLPETLNRIMGMVYDAGHFYIKTSDYLYSLDAASGKVHPGKDLIGIFNRIVERNKEAGSNLNFFKKYINDGYTTINTVRSFYLNNEGELGFDDRHIVYRAYTNMIVIEQDRQPDNGKYRLYEATEQSAPVMDIANKNLKFSRFVWPDGSEVLADSRGLLHLKSSDKSLPEITMVMIMGKPTACWSSDGRVCGSVYFTGIETEESQDVTGFYFNYVQRFIDTLKKHATIATI